MKKWLFMAAGVLVVVSLGSCSFLSESATSLLISPAEEVELGENLAAEVEKEVTLHPSEEVQAEFQAMGDELVAHLSEDVPSEYTFEFHVVQDDTQINAFAAPGGQIFFYTGLLLTAANEAAVMGVLAHEIAHVTERHGAKQMASQLGLDALLQLILGGTESQWATLLGDLGKTGVLLSYGREDETEADREGLTLLLKAGYNPEPFIGFFELLGEEDGASEFLSFLSTHPAPGERARELRKHVDALQDVPVYEGDPASFDAFLSKL